MFSFESMDIRVERGPGNKDWLVRAESQTSMGNLLGYAKLRDEQIDELPYCLQDVVGKMLDSIKQKESN